MLNKNSDLFHKDTYSKLDELGDHLGNITPKERRILAISQAMGIHKQPGLHFLKPAFCHIQNALEKEEMDLKKDRDWRNEQWAYATDGINSLTEHSSALKNWFLPGIVAMHALKDIAQSQYDAHNEKLQKQICKNLEESVMFSETSGEKPECNRENINKYNSSFGARFSESMLCDLGASATEAAIEEPMEEIGMSNLIELGLIPSPVDVCKDIFNKNK